MTDKLNLTTEDAQPASSITSPQPPEKTNMDQMLVCIQQYFKDCSYDCGKAYMDGYNVELLRDKLDVSTLITSLTRMVFDELRKQEHLDDDRRIEFKIITEVELGIK